jgi:hypothetical protein
MNRNVLQYYKPTLLKNLASSVSLRLEVSVQQCSVSYAEVGSVLHLPSLAFKTSRLTLIVSASEWLVLGFWLRADRHQFVPLQ